MNTFSFKYYSRTIALLLIIFASLVYLTVNYFIGLCVGGLPFFFKTVNNIAI